MILKNFHFWVLSLIIFVSSCNSNAKLSEFDYSEEEKKEYVENIQKDTPYFNDNEIVYEDHIYSPSIKTDKLFATGSPLSSPVIELNSGRTITLSFDDLSPNVEDYYYKVIHCDARWNPTDIMENQFIEGFFSDAIPSYDFSFNTLVPYVHYELTFPNSGMKVKLSGNYILLVIKDNEIDQPVLAKRFMVYENKVSLASRVRRSPANAERNYKQVVEFEVQHFSFPINNPYRDIEVVVRQNERWDNALYDLKPIFIKNKRLIYESPNKYSFDGGNEYRFFNIRSVRYNTEQISRITIEDDVYNAYLIPFGKRSFSVYTTRFDINGKYEIRTTDANDSRVEADYVFVHFSLPYEEPILDANIYAIGAFSNRQTHKSNQLFYNDDKQQYEATIMLKQGYYDYQYALTKDSDHKISTQEIEGSHFTTENEYHILVYYKDISNDYQQLIGSKIFNSQDF